MATATKSQTKVTAPVQTAEELAAAEAEQVVPISKEGLRLQRRYHKIQAMKKALDAELEEIKAFHEAEMKDQGAKALSYRGVVAVEMVDTTKTTNDYKGLWKAHPEIQAVFISKFQTKEPSVRYDAKKAV